MSSNKYIPSNNTQWRLIGIPNLDIKIDKKWKSKQQLRNEYKKDNDNQLDNQLYIEENLKVEKSDKIINNHELNNNYINTSSFNNELEKLRHQLIVDNTPRMSRPYTTPHPPSFNISTLKENIKISKQRVKTIKFGRTLKDTLNNEYINNRPKTHLYDYKPPSNSILSENLNSLTMQVPKTKTTLNVPEDVHDLYPSLGQFDDENLAELTNNEVEKVVTTAPSKLGFNLIRPSTCLTNLGIIKPKNVRKASSVIFEMENLNDSHVSAKKLLPKKDIIQTCFDFDRKKYSQEQEVTAALKELNLERISIIDAKTKTIRNSDYHSLRQDISAMRSNADFMKIVLLSQKQINYDWLRELIKFLTMEGAVELNHVMSTSLIEIRELIESKDGLVITREQILLTNLPSNSKSEKLPTYFHLPTSVRNANIDKELLVEFCKLHSICKLLIALKPLLNCLEVNNIFTFLIENVIMIEPIALKTCFDLLKIPIPKIFTNQIFKDLASSPAKKSEHRRNGSVDFASSQLSLLSKNLDLGLKSGINPEIYQLLLSSPDLFPAHDHLQYTVPPYSSFSARPTSSRMAFRESHGYKVPSFERASGAYSACNSSRSRNDTVVNKLMIDWKTGDYTPGQSSRLSRLLTPKLRNYLNESITNVLTTKLIENEHYN